MQVEWKFLADEARGTFTDRIVAGVTGLPPGNRRGAATWTYGRAVWHFR
jgi:hypothetical protein